MKVVRLQINDNANLRFELLFHLNTLNVKICRKLASAEWIVEDWQSFHNITEETDIHEILEKTYDSYVAKKGIEDFWVNNFKGALIVEIRESQQES